MIETIPYLDLRAQVRSLQPELQAAVAQVIDNGSYLLAEPVEAFEHAFAKYCGVSHAVALNAGGSALHLALLAAGVGPGDEVITVSMAFVATVAAIVDAGAVPRFVDIDPERGTMDPRQIEAALTGRTRAIIPVHLHGRVADMTPILNIARVNGLAVIEDAGQAHGARYRGRRVGAIADMSCFSFHPAMNLGACGQGGALTTDDDVLARRVRIMRNWGKQEKYVHAVHGFDYRMDAIQGAVLGIKLPHLDTWTQARRAVAQRYDGNLAAAGIRTPAPAAEGQHVYHVYAVRVANRDRLRNELAQAGVATGIHYPVPVHLQPAYRDLGHRRGDFPHTERFAAETLSLPIYPELTMGQVDRVCEILERLTRGAHVGNN